MTDNLRSMVATTLQPFFDNVIDKVVTIISASENTDSTAVKELIEGNIAAYTDAIEHAVPSNLEEIVKEAMTHGK